MNTEQNNILDLDIIIISTISKGREYLLIFELTIKEWEGWRIDETQESHSGIDIIPTYIKDSETQLLIESADHKNGTYSWRGVYIKAEELKEEFIFDFDIKIALLPSKYNSTRSLPNEDINIEFLKEPKDIKFRVGNKNVEINIPNESPWFNLGSFGIGFGIAIIALIFLAFIVKVFKKYSTL